MRWYNTQCFPYVYNFWGGSSRGKGGDCRGQIKKEKNIFFF